MEPVVENHTFSNSEARRFIRQIRQPGSKIKFLVMCVGWLTTDRGFMSHTELKISRRDALKVVDAMLTPKLEKLNAKIKIQVTKYEHVTDVQVG